MNHISGAKYRWVMNPCDQELALAIAGRYNLSVPLAQTLVARGLVSEDALNSYLFSSFGNDVGDPALLKDARKAVDRIMMAIERREKILICGDYDVDGITSSALLMSCLPALGADINFFLPNRMRDGYGLSPQIVERAARNNYSVIITVDNGITAFAAAEVAKKNGVDLIITDHHRPHEHLPDAYAIVNPNQQDCPYPYKSLAGVGVTFKVLSLLYRDRGLEIPPKIYELLLLGTIADVVPLTGENRYWVRHGLRHVNAYESFPLKVLKTNSNFGKPKLTATDIGFFIAPQINALGRLEDARAGVGFLIGSDEPTIERTGRVLFELNTARKEIERAIAAQVVAEVESKRINLETENVIIAASKDWQPGVIGLVASRIVGAYGRPTILLHITDSGLVKGSCRSIPGFNLFNALKECEDLLEQFGGHSMAAGLSLKMDNLPALKERLEAIVARDLTPEDLLQKLPLDAQVRLGDLTAKFVADMEYLEPFGNENPCPTFYVHGVTLVEQPRLLKDQHVKCSVFADGVIKPVMFFGRPELFEWFMMLPEGQSFDIAARVTENHWQGRVNIELQGIDVALSGCVS